jgi:hypothetical protein
MIACPFFGNLTDDYNGPNAPYQHEAQASEMPQLTGWRFVLVLW